MRARTIVVTAVLAAIFGAPGAIAQTKRLLPAVGSSREVVAADLIATCSVEAASALPVLSSGIPANLTPTQRTQWAKSQVAGIALHIADPKYYRDTIEKQNASDTLNLSSPDQEVRKTAAYSVCATKRRLEHIAAECPTDLSAKFQRTDRLLDAITYFPMLEAVELGLEKEQAAALRDPRRLLWTYRVLILDVDAGIAEERNCSSAGQDHATEIEMRDKALRECPQRFSRQECTQPLSGDERKGPPPRP